jgi:hypothetical protein
VVYLDLVIVLEMGICEYDIANGEMGKTNAPFR